MDFLVFQQLGIAVLLGSLIGLEREQKFQQNAYEGFGGVRTFALIGLLGALSYTLFYDIPQVFGIFVFGFLMLIAVSYFMAVKYMKIGLGATSEVASVLVFLIGVLCGMGQFVVATAVCLAVVAILHFKSILHGWAKNLQNAELVSTLQFAIIAFVVLPLLPNQGYGPYEFFNPYVVWLMVVFISGISFASYVAIKFLGAKRGIGLTGFLTGLISSTALTFSFSALSKKMPKVVNPFVLGIVVASSAMFFRVLVEVLFVNRELFIYVLPPILAMGLVGVAASIALLFMKDGAEEKLKSKLAETKSPFNIVPALKFAAIFALILFLVEFAKAEMGNEGILLTSIISGFVDVDAITISLANLAKTDLDKEYAAFAITIAAMINTLSKGLIFLALGGRKVALRILMVFTLMIAVGGAVLFLL